MWAWLRNLFVWDDDPVRVVPIGPKTLADRQAEATVLGNQAIALFDRIVEDLDASADTLRSVAEEAQEIARQYEAQSRAAAEEAVQNINRAVKIRDLLS